MFYIITAQIVRKTENGTISKQVPTFYLNGDIQGITNLDTAEKVAKDVIDPFGEHEVHVCIETAFENPIQ